MLEILLATMGGLYAFSRVISVIRSFIFVEEKLKMLAARPVSDREATLYDHVLSAHQEPIKYCQTSACAGLV